MAGRKRKCKEGEIWTESFGCIKPVKEDDGISWEQLCAILDQEEEEAKKITPGLPSHHRRRRRPKKRKKKSSLEAGVREAVEEGIINRTL